MDNEDSDFMGYKATFHCRPIIKRGHNKRDPEIVSSEEHIDLSRPHETILDCGTLEECYEQIFGEAKKNTMLNRSEKTVALKIIWKQFLTTSVMGNTKI